MVGLLAGLFVCFRLGEDCVCKETFTMSQLRDIEGKGLHKGVQEIKGLVCESREEMGLTYWLDMLHLLFKFPNSHARQRSSNETKTK